MQVLSFERVGNTPSNPSWQSRLLPVALELQFLVLSWPEHK